MRVADVEYGANVDSASGVDIARMKALWTEVHASLQSKKEHLYAEIRAYPFPIPACDAQYNYLLEKRDLVNQEIRKWEALWDAPMNLPEALAHLESIVNASTNIDAETKQRIRQAAHQAALGERSL